MRDHIARRYRGQASLQKVFASRFRSQRSHVMALVRESHHGKSANWVLDEGKLRQLMELDAEEFVRRVQEGDLDIFEIGTAAGTDYLTLIGSVAAPVTLDRELPHVIAAACGDLSARMSKLEQTSLEQVTGIMKQGVTEGWSLGEMTRALGDTFTSWTSSTPLKQSRAEMVARTESAMAYNRGSCASWRENGFDGVEVFDGGAANSCEECDSLNGAIWSIDRSLAEPVSHPNCGRDFAPVHFSEALAESAPEGE